MKELEMHPTADELALVPCTFTSIFTFYSFTDRITFLHKTPLLLDLLCSRFHILRSRVTLAVTVSPIRSWNHTRGVITGIQACIRTYYCTWIHYHAHSSFVLCTKSRVTLAVTYEVTVSCTHHYLALRLAFSRYLLVRSQISEHSFPDLTAHHFYILRSRVTLAVTVPRTRSRYRICGAITGISHRKLPRFRAGLRCSWLHCTLLIPLSYMCSLSFYFYICHFSFIPISYSAVPLYCVRMRPLWLYFSA